MASRGTFHYVLSLHVCACMCMCKHMHTCHHRFSHQDLNDPRDIPSLPFSSSKTESSERNIILKKISLSLFWKTRWYKYLYPALQVIKELTVKAIHLCPSCCFRYTNVPLPKTSHCRKLLKAQIPHHICTLL